MTRICRGTTSTQAYHYVLISVRDRSSVPYRRTTIVLPRSFRPPVRRQHRSIVKTAHFDVILFLLNIKAEREMCLIYNTKPKKSLSDDRLFFLNRYQFSGLFSSLSVLPLPSSGLLCSPSVLLSSSGLSGLRSESSVPGWLWHAPGSE